MIIDIVNSIAKAAQNLVEVLDPGETDGDDRVGPRPPECFEGEDVYRWLLAEARWLLGNVAAVAHQIRLRENAFEHDSVQRDCNLGHPPADGNHCER